MAVALSRVVVAPQAFTAAGADILDAGNNSVALLREVVELAAALAVALTPAEAADVGAVPQQHSGTRNVAVRAGPML